MKQHDLPAWTLPLLTAAALAAGASGVSAQVFVTLEELDLREPPCAFQGDGRPERGAAGVLWEEGFILRGVRLLSPDPREDAGEVFEKTRALESASPGKSTLFPPEGTLLVLLPAPEFSGGRGFEDFRLPGEEVFPAPDGMLLPAGFNVPAGAGGEELARLNGGATLPFPVYLAAILSLGAIVGVLGAGGARPETGRDASGYY